MLPPGAFGVRAGAAPVVLTRGSAGQCGPSETPESSLESLQSGGGSDYRRWTFGRHTKLHI